MAGTLNMSLAAEALKFWYLDGLTEQMNNATPLLAQLERDTASVQGSQIVMALRYGRNGGVGNRRDDGDLPTPNARKTKQAKWETKNLFGRIMITDKTMRASRSDRGAFVSLLEAELEDCMTDARDNLGRQAHGDGSGVLATCTAQTAVTTLVLNSVQMFAEGMLIDIINGPDGAVKQAAREVLVVDDINSSIGISGAAVTTLVTDQIAVNGSYGLEITGLTSVFTPNNTLYGVNRATEKWFNPTIIPAGGEISEVLLQKGDDEVDRKAGGKIDFYSASYGVARAYQNLLIATKQTVEVMKLKGGYDVLTYNGRAFTRDKYAASGTLHGLDLNSWRMYEMMGFDWLDEDGNVLSRVAGKPAWEATLANYCDLGCNKPRGNFKMTGITEH